MRVSNEFDYSIINDIKWGYSKYGTAGKNLDITNYIFEDWFSNLETYSEDKQSYIYTKVKC